MKILVLGLGNPILSDDGVGFVLVDELQKIITNQNIVFEKISLAGMEVLETMLDYDKVILLDSIQLGDEPGKVHLLTEDDIHLTQHSSTHDLGFKTVLDLGKQYYADRMPKQLLIYGIEAKDVVTFSESLTPEVKEKIPEIIKEIVKEF
ncbi:MAG: hydrogenase maturation protease [Candidatus Hodarchaeales archaeon]|jgi:hydrogenase maturation protease